MYSFLLLPKNKIGLLFGLMSSNNTRLCMLPKLIIKEFWFQVTGKKYTPTLSPPLHIAIKHRQNSRSGNLRTQKSKQWHSDWGRRSNSEMSQNQGCVFHVFFLQPTLAWTQCSRPSGQYQGWTEEPAREATSFHPEGLNTELLTPKESTGMSHFVSSFISLFSHTHPPSIL